MTARAPAWKAFIEWLGAGREVAIIRAFEEPLGDIGPDGSPLKPFAFCCVGVRDAACAHTMHIKATLSVPPGAVPACARMLRALGYRHVLWERWKARGIVPKRFRIGAD